MARDNHYPTVDLDFLAEQVRKSTAVIPDSEYRVGNTVSFTLEGTKPISKRLVLLRDIGDGQVALESATWIALKLQFLGILMEWLHEKRGWKEGGYTLTPLSQSEQK